MIGAEVFDSKKEAKRYQELKQLERAGRICNLQRQVKYILIPAQRAEASAIYTKGNRKGQPKEGKLIERECSYYADFVYYDRNKNQTVVEDVKGYKGGAAYAIFKLKKKLMLFVHKIYVIEV
jgi:hypothetical protein